MVQKENEKGEEEMKARRERPTKRMQTDRPAYLDDDRALAADLYAHRKDPGFASEKAVKIESRPTGMQVVSFRLPTEELREVLEAAKDTGESLSAFVRTALMIRLGHEAIVSPVELTFGAFGTTGNMTWQSLTGAMQGHNIGLHASRRHVPSLTVVSSSVPVQPS